jgi:hypothetical protein
MFIGFPQPILETFSNTGCQEESALENQFRVTFH